MRVLRLFLVCCVALTLTSCKESQYKDAILGKWEMDGVPGVTLFEFRKDGTMSFGGQSAKWKLDGSDNLWVTSEQEIDGEKKFTTKVEITGDVMKMTDPDGKVTTCRRAGAQGSGLEKE